MFFIRKALRRSGMVRRRDKVVGLIVTEYLNFSLLSNFIWLIVRVFFLCCIEKEARKKENTVLGH